RWRPRSSSRGGIRETRARGPLVAPWWSMDRAPGRAMKNALGVCRGVTRGLGRRRCGAQRQVEVARSGSCWRRVVRTVVDIPAERAALTTPMSTGGTVARPSGPTDYAGSMSVKPGRPLKVGIQLPEVEREVRWPELLDMTRAIEAEGFDSVWVGEHLLYRWPDRPPRGPWEAWTLLAAIAASTTRIELGPLVACTNFHNPALLAKQAVTIDELSGGRFVLGLGAGWNETEFRAFGFPFDHRIDRFGEAFTIIRTLLREGAIDFDGRW